jgi:predicted metalloprotease
MQWRGRSGSGNVEDRRGMGGLAVGGGIGGVVVLILSLLFGGDLSSVINTDTDNQSAPQQSSQSRPDDEAAQFVSVVLKDTEDVWAKIFAEENSTYIDPKLVLFTRATQSGCGFATQASGPFYCPSDSKVYIDLSFYDELRNRFGASGDFAMAYVVAHEVGHHVQHLLGITAKLDHANRNLSESERNALSVKLELQADFLAGVWAHYEDSMKKALEEGDIEEALNAANAIGDDRLQKMSQGYVVPDAFTHGTSKQRMYWFKKGFDTGDLDQGDTFAERSLPGAGAAMIMIMPGARKAGALTNR